MQIHDLHLIISIVGGVLGLITAIISILCVLFYTKSQVEKKIKEAQSGSEEKVATKINVLDADIKSFKSEIYSDIESFKNQIDFDFREMKNQVDYNIKDIKNQMGTDIKEIKEVVTEFRLLNQKERSEVRDELHTKLEETKQALDSAMKQFLNYITDIKQNDNDMALNLVTLVNGVKDELKNDYTARYNDLLVLINGKADESDFNRLEQKFDKVSETITELKTIVQMQLDKNKPHLHA